MHILVFSTDMWNAKISSITFLKRDSITEALLAVLKNSRNTPGNTAWSQFSVFS